ncbi:hypothetical protein AFLA_007033 [Aspergillus flavus NRRL3357]|nr:hypothetical protein AFLA_007033 [Aspergillus flavus NRRL3357]
MHDVFMTTTAIEKLGNFPVLPEPTYFSPLTIQWIDEIGIACQYLHLSWLLTCFRRSMAMSLLLSKQISRFDNTSICEANNTRTLFGVVMQVFQLSEGVECRRIYRNCLNGRDLVVLMCT